MEKVTYASLASLGEEFHQAFDNAVRKLLKPRKATFPIYVGGKKQQTSATFEDRSPTDTLVMLGTFSSGTPADIENAITAAKRAFPKWRDLGWRERIKLLRRAAAIMTERQIELAAVVTLESGKNRLEAIAEVSESIDLILYYASQMEENQGYEKPLVTTGAERTKSVLRPYGVWAVISPFNFPLALATGMSAGALLGGNTVVFKPPTDTPWAGILLGEIFHAAGLPAGVFNVITGSGSVLGETLLASDRLDGIVFTGSREVGGQILRRFQKKWPRPCIAEMGGKNPAIIMPSANLDDATEGVMRSAFGMGGQKCSACSRLYLHKDIYGPFLDLLVHKTKQLKIGDPTRRDTFLGPLINANAVKTYDKAMRLARKSGRIICGGNRLKDDEFANGFFVEPAIVDQLSIDSRMYQDEFFAPILSVAKVSSLDEAITLSNNTVYGLTAGLFTEEEDEQRKFFEGIEAGVTYCNRRGGVTTGAWPGVQSFGGWKASGSSGKSALGPYYVAQFMREQSRTNYRK